MSDNSAMVEHFHDKFGIPRSPRPKVPPLDRRDLRVRLIVEELEEFAAASASGDIVEAADGLADLMYVIFGAALEWGIPLDYVFAEVHRSNMSKLWDGPTGKEARYRADGKVLKPPSYSQADVAGVLAGVKDGI